jgi:hypothetical protein
MIPSVHKELCKARDKNQESRVNVFVTQHFFHLFPVGFQIGQTIGLLDLSAASGCWARYWDAVSASVAI